MVRSRYRVVSIRLNAFDCIIIFKLVLILHYLENLVVIRHFLLARKEPTDEFLFIDFKPRVRTNIFNRVTGVRIRVQDLS